MVYIKNSEQIAKIKEAGQISKTILLKLLSAVQAGMSTSELNKFAESEIQAYGAEPWFKEVNDFKYAICTSVNDSWIHGLPGNEVLKVGDIISIDIGIKKDGLYVDNCWTVDVKASNQAYNAFPEHFDTGNDELDRFLEAGVEALYNAINAISTKERTGVISHTMQTSVENAGYSVIREYAGHGVGITMHEDPLIGCYGSKNSGTPIKNGMVLAVEVMYAMGKPEIRMDKDNWTVHSRDGSVTGMFEHTVAVIGDQALILTN